MLLKYLKDRTGCIALFVLFTAIFGTLAFLYGLQLDGVVYAVVVAGIICIIFSIVDFIRYTQKQKSLEYMLNSLEDASLLPASKTMQEASYQEIICELQKQLFSLTTKNNLTYSEMKDFYSLWVHQIKTPIAAISILLQNDTTENAGILKQELFKIERYTEIVLNYLRLEDFSSDFSVGEYNLEKIVNQAVKKFAPVFINKNISVKLTGLDAVILTDEKWLVFAIEQLISNALKYTSNNGEIKICFENSTHLIIEDNGIGISPEDLPRIFEKGFTGYNGRMDKKATGIGLYLTKKTLDKLGNTIQIFSDGKQGTAVKIDLSRQNITHE